MHDLKIESPFLKLGSSFYTKLLPESVTNKPELLHYNQRVADQIGLNIPESKLQQADMLMQLCGQKIQDGVEPYAMVYSGHQFGHWAGQLGDGRALMLGQCRSKDDALWDIQFKGSGRTPYSRFGDGRAVIRSSIREYLCSEAMYQLGIPTTQALCLIATQEDVIREQIEPGAILTRISNSHIRFGHFEHFYHNDDEENLRKLADFVIDQHYPHFKDCASKYLDWFKTLCDQTAQLIAQWQSVGFCHGVMNTDNMSAIGLTIDYGPFGFLEDYNPNHICNQTDHSGRYAYAQQPHIGMWNLYALANCLRPMVPWNDLIAAIEKDYAAKISNYFAILMRGKIGCEREDSKADNLWQSLLKIASASKMDFTLIFRLLSPEVDLLHEEYDGIISTEKARNALKDWQKNYHTHMQSINRANADVKIGMNQVNPKYILRNWLAEKAIRAAEDYNDYSVLESVFKVISNPFEEHEIHSELSNPATEEQRGIALSCSS